MYPKNEENMMSKKYIDTFRVNYGEYVFILKFDEDETEDLVFVLSPSLMKAFSQQAVKLVAEYEEKYGKVNTEDIEREEAESKSVSIKNSYQ